MGMFGYFHINTKTNLQPSKGCPLGVFRCSLTLPYTPPHMLSFLKPLNQNVTLRSIPFFEDVSCIHSKNEQKKHEAAACCGGFTNTASDVGQQRRRCALKLTVCTPRQL